MPVTRQPLPGDWSGLVVVVGAVPWDGSRMLDQHLALGMARYAPVLYVDLPQRWRPGRRWPQREPRPDGRGTDVRLVHPGLALVTPHVLPGHQRAGVKAVSMELVRRTMRQALADLGSPTVRAVIVPSPEPCLGVCGEEVKVYYASDDFVAGADLMGLSARRLEREVRRQPGDADLVVAASPALAELLRAQGHDPLLLPNGCDPEAFARTEQAEPAGDVRLDGAMAGFMGHLSSRIDPRYLGAVADRGHPLLLVGPAPRELPDEFERLVRRPNVHWTGPRPFAALPGYLRHVAVGLVPYTDTAFNRASFPLKALEYLAAGRPVVSTDIPAMRWLREGRNVGDVGDVGDRTVITDADLVVTRSPAEFADAVIEMATANATPDAGAAARRLAFARAHSWERRFAVLARALGLADPAGPTGPAVDTAAAAAAPVPAP
jgi:glycosyltransferase involved in cell wall biosynthesis